MIILLRLVLAIVAGAVGNFLGRANIPPNAPIEVPTWTGAAATIVFAIAGFTLPDILSFLAKAGIVRLAQELVKYIPAQLPKAPIKLRLPRQHTNLQNGIILDTSTIVDGRIVEVIKTGFLTNTLIVIPSVISELHHLADSANDLKRARGRVALELLDKLKKEKLVHLKIISKDPAGKTVDEKLVELAKRLRGKILTCDFNLEKVAKIKNIKILNVNELSQAVRVQVLPGETFKINLIHKGKTLNQGVGYLPDGTMVVVEDGGKFVGTEVDVKVHRSLQTVAGRMVFAKFSTSS